jgi:hypothetical protein
MSTLAGPLKIIGPMGALTFYTTSDGKTIVRQKGGPSREKVLNHHNFIRSRENFTDFGSVSKVASNIRRALGPLLSHTSEGSYFNRLVGLLKMISETDVYNEAGSQNPFNGNVYLLEDFQWNAKLSFKDALQTEYSSFVDVAQGKVRVVFESFVPIAAVKAPARATHFQVMLKSAIIRAGQDSPAMSPEASALFALDSNETGVIDLSMDLNTANGALLMMGLCIVFYEEVLGVPMMLRGGAFQTIAVERIPVKDNDTEAAASLAGTDAASDGTGKKKSRSEAMEAMSDSLYARTNGAGHIKTPILKDPQAALEMEERLHRAQRQLWLKKLEKYRNG